MMVKNEEEMLPQCLESIKDVVDEIIVVDTGSEDRTVEIAESFGAKVYHHTWENDFSKHRNQSISYATGDWFLIIDADERVDAEKLSVEKIKNHLANLREHVNAVLATVVDHKRDETENVRFKSARLFRNDVGIHYEGIVHNKPVYNESPVNSDLEIHHYGYDLDQAKMDAKFVRTTNLLKQRINENPDDFEAYFYLANSYGSKKMIDKTIEYSEKSIELMPDNLPNNKLYNSAYYTLCGCYITKQKLDVAKKWAYRGLKLNKYDIGLYFRLINIALQEKDFIEVKKNSLKYLESYEIIAKDPVRAGGQFIFNTDESSYKAVQYWLLSSYLVLKEFDTFWKLWNEVKSKIFSEEKLQNEILKNAKTANESSIIVPVSIELFTKLDRKTELLYPLAEWMIESNFTFDVIKKFIHYLPDSDDAQIQLLDNLAENFQKIGKPLLIFKFKDKLSQSICNSLSFKAILLKAAHSENNTPLLREEFETLLDNIESFNELPENALLILSNYLLETEDINNFITVTDVLLKINNIKYDKEISDFSELAKVYELLGENYNKSGQYYYLQTAYEIAFRLTGNFDMVKKVADQYFATEDYQKNIVYYNKLLQNNCANQHSLVNLKQSFLAIGNEEAAEKCTRLLQAL
ncbi:MAG TPA: glycosyltransferase family 2 protein [Bacteroidales bacterium]|nr:glycosyltransferase family 2 protein [Bacteroidales bacterium]